VEREEKGPAVSFSQKIDKNPSIPFCEFWPSVNNLTHLHYWCWEKLRSRGPRSSKQCLTTCGLTNIPCMIHDTHNSIHTNKTIKDAPVGLACVRVIYPLSCEP